jgi:hypothetical protein
MNLDETIRGPAGDAAWLQDIRAKTGAEAVLPLYIEGDGNIRIVAAVIVSTDAIQSICSTPTGWQRLADFELENGPSVHVEGLTSSVVSFTGKDATTARTLGYELGARIADVHNIVFSSYQPAPPRFGDISVEDACDCSGLRSNSVRRVPGVSFVEGDRLFICSHGKIHGIEYHGKKRPLETVLDAEWLFEDVGSERIVPFEADPDDAFGVYLPKDGEERAARIVATLNAIGMLESDTPFSKYDPEHHEALLNIQGDTVAGYLTWENLDAFQTLRQLFVRGRFRHRGVASTLVRTWCREYCTGRTYYIDETNDAGRAVFDALGHSSGGGEYTAVDLHVLRSSGNSLENAEFIRG